MESRVSVIMPVYNGIPYLSESIESILNQNYRDFEFIIVDDSSTDQSYDVLSRYAEKDQRIRLMRNEKNLGHAETSNAAIALARGEFIARQDQDDLSLPGRLEAQVAFLDLHPEVGILGTAYFQESRQKRRRVRKSPLTHTAIRWKLVFDCALAHTSVMMRADILKNQKPVYRNLPGPQDYDLWTRLCDRTRAASLSAPLVVYRQPSASGMTSLYREKLHEAVLDISAQQIRKLLPQQSFTHEDLQALHRLYSFKEIAREDIMISKSMLELFDAFAQLPDINRKILRNLKRNWVRRMIAAIPTTLLRDLWSLGIFKKVVRQDPLVLPDLLIAFSRKALHL